MRLYFKRPADVGRLFEGKFTLPRPSNGLLIRPWRLHPLIRAGSKLAQMLDFERASRAGNAGLVRYANALLDVSARALVILQEEKEPAVLAYAKAAEGKFMLLRCADDSIIPLSVYSEEGILKWHRGDPSTPPSFTLEFKDIATLATALAQRNDPHRDLGSGTIRLRGNIPLAEKFEQALDRIAAYIPPR
ncbi:MAG: hypothetical protein ACOCVG_04955 [Verrucomicrobiota bacterium]